MISVCLFVCFNSKESIFFKLATVRTSVLVFSHQRGSISSGNSENSKEEGGKAWRRAGIDLIDWAIRENIL